MPKLKIKFGRKDNYDKGALVEVRSEEKAYKGSWYCARILSLLGDDKYVVEHLKFRSDDGESIPLKDLVEGHNMRPVPPPELSTVVCYEPGDEVDAWFNQRWWIGRVSKVLDRGSKYLVYFISSGEEPVVLNFNLRPHKDWIDGQWVYPAKVLTDLVIGLKINVYAVILIVSGYLVMYRKNAANLHLRR